MDLRHDRVGRDRAKAGGSLRGLRPVPQRGVGEEDVADDVGILRIEFFHPLINGERFFPATLAPANRRDVGADVAVVRQGALCDGEFGQGTLVILVEPISALAKYEMGFA
ncbi:MAG: hypothetical protein H0W66_09210 [Chthoniobacterales bacterium]|nr:hypothetical protein [Chthoniobacterales bacterium]